VERLVEMVGLEVSVVVAAESLRTSFRLEEIHLLLFLLVVAKEECLEELQ
jgi:hypothetical protein